MRSFQSTTSEPTRPCILSDWLRPSPFPHPLSGPYTARTMYLTPQTAFKANNFPTAIRAYSQSADMALSRPPWELAALGREETSIALCNRSAAFALAGEWYVYSTTGRCHSTCDT